MRLDLYSKIVLTVIAAALTALAAQNALQPAIAQGAGCGTQQQPPCLVVPAIYDNVNGAWRPCFAIDVPCFNVFARTRPAQ